jgi:hypothetical protein
MALMRQFDSGATRNLDDTKLDFEGFLSPLVIERFAEYMHKHRQQADGAIRDSDNWQKGIPQVAYMKSGYRHFFDWWKEHRGISTNEGLEEALCALLFNVQGYLHEHLKAKQVGCECGTDTCVESWEPGCGLGLDEASVLVIDDEDLGLKAGEAFAQLEIGN